MSELTNYVFDILPDVNRQYIAYFIGSMALVIYATRHDD